MEKNIQTSKIDKNTLGVIETKPIEVLPLKTYDYSFLKNQLISIQKQKDDYDALRDAEIVEVQNLLNEADKLGIVEKVEPTLEPIIKEIIN
jgi:hypothetical protein